MPYHFPCEETSATTSRADREHEPGVNDSL